MKPTLEVIDGNRKGKPTSPDALLDLDGKTFAGQFDTWHLQEVRGGRSTCMVDVREATPDEVQALRKKFLACLKLQVAE